MHLLLTYVFYALLEFSKDILLNSSILLQPNQTLARGNKNNRKKMESFTFVLN